MNGISLMNYHPVLLCSLHDANERSFIQHIVTEEGLGLRIVGSDGDSTWPQPRDLTAGIGLVTETSPDPTSKMAEIHTVRAAHPLLPILLDLPSQPDDIRLAVRWASLFGPMRACVRTRDGQEWARIRSFIRNALETSPTTRVRETVRRIAVCGNSRIVAFVDTALASTAANGTTTIEAVARGIRTPAKQLRDACRRAGLPCPKRILTWLEVLLVIQMAVRDHESIGDAGAIVLGDRRGLARRLERVGLGSIADIEPEEAWARAADAFAVAADQDRTNARGASRRQPLARIA